MEKLKIYIVFTSLLIVSCQKILFNAPEESRVIELNDFHAVRFYGIYNIVLVQDSANRVVIKGKNHIGSIDANIWNDTLIIDDHKKLSFNTNKNSLELHFSTLKFIITYDPVNLSNKDTIKADLLNVTTMGEIAEIRLSVDCNLLNVSTSANTLGYHHYTGRAERTIFFCRYGSSFFADSLNCKSAEIINDTSGDVHVNVSEHIRAYLWGIGNIYYRGSPAIEIVEKRGTGRIIRSD